MGDDRRSTGFTRRRLLAAAGGGAVALATTGGYELGRRDDDSGPKAVPFYGERQAGIATAAQDRLMFASFDITAGRAGEVRELLRTWTDAAAKMTAGRALADSPEPPLAPPLDTGEALDLPAARLTVTFGLGAGLFERDRFGLDARRPALLRPLGPLPGDELQPARVGGDLCVQACADDPTVAFHAVRNLARIGRGTVVVRWTQLGFGRTSAVTKAQSTPRNLMGFKDGTNNLRGDDEEEMRRFVWIGDDEPQEWLRGGTYLVARRIRMLIETWDRASLDDQQLTIGRVKSTGAPLGGHREKDFVDLAATGPDGEPLVPPDAHIRLAGPKGHGGVRILRRGYSFTDGIDPRTGELDAGLFFIAFQRDPHRQFATIQRRLGQSDALNEYIRHTGSGLFVVPPGARPGGFVGEGLFA